MSREVGDAEAGRGDATGRSPARRPGLRALVWGTVALAGIGWVTVRAVRSDASPSVDGRRAASAVASLDAPRTGRAARITYRGATFDVFELDLDESARLELFWRDGRGERLGSLGRLRRHVEGDGRRLVFAMNAGMFDPSFAPLGLYVEDGRRLVDLDTRQGRPGNFYLRPNGVFFVADGEAGILETGEFARRVPPASVTLATQSGPLLVRDGAVHRAFAEGSRHRNLRNGVGVLPGNRVVFAISNQPVNLFDFAMLFRERLGCRDALYLDGAVSRAYLPALDRFDARGNFGAMLAVTEPE